MKTIKVILSQNVPMLGQKDEVKEVKPGFWRNFLVPRGLAVEATPDLLKQAEKRREEAGKQKEQEEKLLLENLEKIKGRVLTIEAKADEKGNLFAAIKPELISEKIKEQLETDVSPETIKTENPIKKIGQHEVGIKDFILQVEIKQE